jgi:hypothetical protein
MTATSSRTKLRGAEWACTKGTLAFGLFWRNLQGDLSP